MPEPLVLAMAGFALLSVILLLMALASVRRRRWIGTWLALGCAGMFLALAVAAGAPGGAMRGDPAPKRGALAATGGARPTGPEKFVAAFLFPDGRRENYEITGNALYVDAHIVKWHPRLNILGLHT